MELYLKIYLNIKVSNVLFSKSFIIVSLLKARNVIPLIIILWGSTYAKLVLSTTLKLPFYITGVILQKLHLNSIFQWFLNFISFLITLTINSSLSLKIKKNQFHF